MKLTQILTFRIFTGARSSKLGWPCTWLTSILSPTPTHGVVKLSQVDTVLLNFLILNHILTMAQSPQTRRQSYEVYPKDLMT
jgi:hypothetical protein